MLSHEILRFILTAGYNALLTLGRLGRGSENHGLINILSLSFSLLKLYGNPSASLTSANVTCFDSPLLYLFSSLTHYDNRKSKMD